MKVLLLNPLNPEPPPVYFGPPYGLSLLGAILKARGVEAAGRDYARATLEEMLSDAEAAVRAEAPDLVGVSCQSSNRGGSIALARRLKEAFPSLRVVVGGPFASTDPELVLRRTGADWVAVGDGEETLPELVAALAAGGDGRGVAGLVWAEGGAAVRAPERAPFTALDSLPAPDFDLFDAAACLERHRRPRAEALCGPVTAGVAMQSALMVLSSRGCIYRCVFCPMSHFKGVPRLHSPAYFADMVAGLARRYGWRDFVFGDNFFTRDRARVLKICALLRRRAPGIRWICMTRADAMDPELARAMAAAGCREISYGVETGSQRVQKTIGKHLDLKRVPAAVATTREAGMSAVLMLMVGNPGDDMAATRETADFLRGFEPDRVLVHTTKVYPGTKIHDAAVACGVVPPGYYEGDEHRAPVFTVERTLEELEAMKAALPSRTLYIEAGAGCVNGCCALRRPGASSGLPGALALASLRAERAVLGGGEALLLKDLESLYDDAEALGLHDVGLYSTARGLADERVAARLRERKDLRRLIVPLFSPDPARHDARARVPGALAQTKLGLRNWRTRGGEVEAWLLPSHEDLAELAGWVRRLAADGVRQAILMHREPPPGWGSLPLEDTPRLGAFAAAAAEAAEAARAAGLPFSVFGLPPCLWDGAAAPRHEDRSLYDETASGASPAGAPPASCRSRVAPRRAFGAACGSCARRPSCDGVWADYLARYGDGELVAA